MPMRALRLTGPDEAPPTVLAIGAHPDDIEIGAGGTLLSLALVHPGLLVPYVVLTGTPGRHPEGRGAAGAFLPDGELTTELHGLPEGRLPAVWDRAKNAL